MYYICIILYIYYKYILLYTYIVIVIYILYIVYSILFVYFFSEQRLSGLKKHLLGKTILLATSLSKSSISNDLLM